MGKFFRFLLPVPFPVALFSSNDTSFVIDIRNDSMVNEQLYFISAKIFTAAKNSKVPFYSENGFPRTDTAMMRSLVNLDVPKVPRLASWITKLRVKTSKGETQFSPVTSPGFPPAWFKLSEMETLIPYNDYVYLENALVHQRTIVLFRRIIDITANQEFHNSFNFPNQGIADRIRTAILNGEVPPYVCNYDSVEKFMWPADAIQAHPVQTGSYFASWPRHWLFSVRMTQAMTQQAYFQYSIPAGYESEPNAPEIKQFIYPYYQFIFRVLCVKGRIHAGEHNLLALGPARKTEGGKWSFAFLAEYIQLKPVFNSFQRRIIDETIRGDVNRSVVWQYSEANFALDQQRDTAITRILGNLLRGSVDGSFTPFVDYELRVRMTRRETESRAYEIADKPQPRFREVTGFGVVHFWYRTEEKNYNNFFKPFVIAPLYYNDSSKTYEPVFYLWLAQVKAGLSPADFELLMEYTGFDVHRRDDFVVVNDTLLSNGGNRLYPVNLFDTYKNGDTVSCRYVLLDQATRPLPDKARIYIVSTGEKTKHPVPSQQLVPLMVQSALFGRGQWGYCDSALDFIILPKFETASPFSEGRARVGKYGRIYGEDIHYTFIDSTGKEFSEYRYNDARDFSGGFAAVQRDKKWGFVNKSMNEVVPCLYDEVRDFHGGFAAVRDSSGWYFIDSSRNRTAETFSQTGDFENSVARVKQNGKWGLLSGRWKFAIVPQYDTIAPFSEGLAAVKKNGQYGFVNARGKTVIPVHYEDVHSFSENRCAVKKNGKWGFIDAKNKTQIPFIYDNAGWFAEGLANVQQNEKWGFIDKQNTLVIGLQFDSVSVFSEGIAAYRNNVRQWGIIDRNGNFIRYAEFSWVGPCREGAIPVSAGQGFSLLDKHGCKLHASVYQARVPYGFPGTFVFPEQRLYLVMSLNNFLYVTRGGKEYIRF